MAIISASQTPLSTVVTRFEERNSLKFKPDTAFYRRVSINKVRFWQLVRGEKEPFISEVTALAHYFNVPITDLI